MLCLRGLFYDCISSGLFTVSNDTLVEELKGTWMDAVVVQLLYHVQTLREDLRKATKTSACTALRPGLEPSSA
jgi:hypothetical protein